MQPHPIIRRPRFPIDRLLTADYIRFRMDWRKATKIWDDLIQHLSSGGKLITEIPGSLNLDPLGYLRIPKRKTSKTTWITVNFLQYDSSYNRWAFFCTGGNSVDFLIEYTEFWEFMKLGISVDKI